MFIETVSLLRRKQSKNNNWKNGEVDEAMRGTFWKTRF